MERKKSLLVSIQKKGAVKTNSTTPRKLYVDRQTPLETLLECCGVLDACPLHMPISVAYIYIYIVIQRIYIYITTKYFLDDNLSFYVFQGFKRLFYGQIKIKRCK
jgi:hypothetical protein